MGTTVHHGKASEHLWLDVEDETDDAEHVTVSVYNKKDKNYPHTVEVFIDADGLHVMVDGNHMYKVRLERGQ